MVPVVSIVGSSNVGKTTFLVELVRELKRRGYRVGTIKHYRHRFEIDQPGKDSWRHFQAGSDVSVISSPHKMALIQRLDAELELDRIVAKMESVDIVLTEGYKGADTPKIEVFRQEQASRLVCGADDLVALVTDRRFDLSVPQYDLGDVLGVADLLEARYILPAAPPGKESN